MESFVKKIWKMLSYKVKCKRKNGTIYHFNQMKKGIEKNEWNRIQTNINSAVLQMVELTGDFFSSSSCFCVFKIF